MKLLFQHDPNEPIGVWLELAEDSRGLFARGRLMPEVTRAREVLSLMRAGALDGLSIGFRTVKGRTDPATGVRRLDQIDLWEISVVTFPDAAGGAGERGKAAAGTLRGGIASCGRAGVRSPATAAQHTPRRRA